MARRSKIDLFNLGSRVSQLAFGDGQTPTSISKMLKAEGYSISPPRIGDWIRKHQDEYGDKVRQQIREHTERELPKDLTAIENMEQISLSWSLENPDQTTERLLTMGKVQAALGELVDEISSAYREPDQNKQTAQLKNVVQRITGWILEDFNWQKKRLEAMKMTLSLIEVKLRYAGIIDQDKGGNIIIKTKARDDRPTGSEPEKSPNRVMFSIRGGKDA